MVSIVLWSQSADDDNTCLNVNVGMWPEECDDAPGQSDAIQTWIVFHKKLSFFLRLVEFACAFRTFNFRRYVGIAVALGSFWGRVPNVRQAAARAKPQFPGSE